MSWYVCQDIFILAVFIICGYIFNMSENDKDNKINFDEYFKKLLDEIKYEAVTFFNKNEKTE